MSYGLTEAGFNAKTLEVIKGEIEDDFRTTFGAQINLLPRTSAGQFIGIMSEALAEVWELLEAVYSELSPDGATGANLDNIAALTGTLREPPTKTRVIATLTGTAGTLVPADSVATVIVSGARFKLVADTTIFEDGTEAEFIADEVGPFVCPAATLTVIATPVSGWSAVTNASDAFVLGSDLETDAALRLRRELELRAKGNAALEPIRQRVIDSDSAIVQVTVFENDTDTTNGDGLPPHSIEVLVHGGDVDKIAQAIFDSKAAGIETYGTSSGNALDPDGATVAVAFTRPTVLTCYVTIDVTVIPDDFPADGADQIIAAIVNYGDTRLVFGSDVVPSALSAQAFKISGVDEVTSVKLGNAPSPSSTARFDVAVREIADLDTTRIVVNVSP